MKPISLRIPPSNSTTKAIYFLWQPIWSRWSLRSMILSLPLRCSSRIFTFGKDSPLLHGWLSSSRDGKLQTTSKKSTNTKLCLPGGGCVEVAEGKITYGWHKSLTWKPIPTSYMASPLYVDEVTKYLICSRQTHCNVRLVRTSMAAGILIYKSYWSIKADVWTSMPR